MSVCRRSFFIYYGAVTFLLCGTEPSFAEEENIIPDIRIGGQVRARADSVKNQNPGDFSFSPDADERQIVSRTRLNVSIKPIGGLKGFIEGQFYDRRNHSDYSQTNLYQAYIELSDIESLPVNLKIGRQDFCYGSAFFLGVNDFYDGLTWDGVNLRVLPKNNLWIDLIGARYVQLNKNTSDDEPALYGAYSSYKLTDDNDIDVYLFYHKGGFKFFHTDLPDSPAWYSFGTRLNGKINGKFDYEIEPIYQFGKIDNPDRLSRDTISSYGGHIEAGYAFDSAFNPRIFTGYAFGKGDSDASDKKYREFHGNVYNDNYLVGDTSVVPDLSGVTVGALRASGMHILIAGVSADIHPKLNLNLDYHYFLADKTPAEINENLGSEVNLIFTYKPFRDINIAASINRFFTGRFFKDAAASGRDIDYFYVQAQFEF